MESGEYNIQLKAGQTQAGYAGHEVPPRYFNLPAFHDCHIYDLRTEALDFLESKQPLVTNRTLLQNDDAIAVFKDFAHMENRLASLDSVGLPCLRVANDRRRA